MIPSRARAFATAYAVMMLGLLASTFLALATLFAAQAHRTQAAGQEAQARQLLLAGTRLIQQNLNSAAPLPTALALPTSLSGASLTARELAPPTSEQRLIRLEALTASVLLRQDLQFAKTSTGWHLASATLSPTLTPRRPQPVP